MKIDGNAVYYLLRRQFDDVEAHFPRRSPVVDYPLLYDDQGEIAGHTVLVPKNVMPSLEEGCENTVFVCIGEQSARAAIDAGLAVIYVHGGISLQTLHNVMQTTYVTHERLDAQLNAYLDAYAGFLPLLEACAKAMGCACAIGDNAFRIIGQADGRDQRDPTWCDELFDEGAVDLFMASRGYEHTHASRRVFAIPSVGNALLKNIFSDGNQVGIVAVEHAGDALSARYARFLLEYLSPFVEAMYARLGSFDTGSNDSLHVHTIFTRAIRGDASALSALDQALCEVFGEEANSYVVLRFERSFTYEGSEGLAYLTRRIERALPHAYCAPFDEGLFTLVNVQAGQRNRSSDVPHGLAQFARDALTKVGMSRPFSSCSELEGACAQARAALEQGSATHPSYWFYRFDDYALGWLLSHGTSVMPIASAIHPAIRVLADYDKQHGSDLVHTLHEFMRCRYNATEAAAQLFVARSTLLNRLVKIEELTGVNLERFEERVYLGASFEALSLETG